ncbi:MAG: purF [Clostridia bacterium]|nr:purF [Clostridia bacterium]
MFNKINEECGVFGIYSVDEKLKVAEETYLALYALQHRGQESCGIAVNDKGVIVSYKDLGLVHEVFNPMVMKHLEGGQMAIGHTRYSTIGSASRENAQPLVSKYVKGTIALAHNGNLVNAGSLRTELENNGAIFQTTNDSEVMLYVLAKERIASHTVEEAVLRMMDIIKGAYSLVIMSPRKLIAVRDPQGFRPLCMGNINDSIVFASESCALDALGAKFIRDVEPGEVIVVDENGIQSYKKEKQNTGLCIFEFIYFARPDSVIDGASVHLARQEAGRYLAIEHPVDADIVCGVPDSGLDAALGYSKQSGIPYGLAFIKNRYIGRTFIQSSQDERERSVKIKLNALKASIDGKRVVLIDDSIVRGTTTAKTIKLLKDAGAKEVHMRISSPPFMHPCFFGTDVDSCENLIACKMSVDKICETIGADSLGYLSLENVIKIPVGSNRNYCFGCFSGKYPIDVPEKVEKNKFERKLSE